ncbi:MAG: monovalent cation/H+ antiporter complex subunit F [Propionibacteriaceae bacterium]|nr:monovalent cation/H+ antiporter complex subunit F [Propionibacteriaceae bacterium]
MSIVTQALIVAAALVLVLSALFALFRLAKGPTGLDRGVASDVMIAVLIGGLATHAIATRTSVGLIVILVLSLLGFTSAVGLARLITGTSARERRFLEAEARAAHEDRERAEREKAERERAASDRFEKELREQAEAEGTA